MKSPQFTRTIENFICLHCASEVQGDGYTNHCPHCLWSMHVDQHPGDRLHRCRGMMEPVRFEVQGGEERVLHQCIKCGHTRWNRTSEHDNRDLLFTLMNVES